MFLRMTRPRVICFLFLGFFFAYQSPTHSASLRLQNSGFENDIGGSNNWDNTANRGISIQTSGAPQGNRMLRLAEGALSAGTAGAFTFQTVSGAKPGDQVAFSGLVRATTLDVGDAGQLRIEFEDSAGTDISATNVSVTTTSASFSRVFVSGAAPAGTAQISFVIRIQPSAVGGASLVEFDDTQGTIDTFPITLFAGGGTGAKHPGEMALVQAKVANTSADSLTGVELVATASEGLDILADKTTFDSTSPSHREGSVIFSLGTLQSGQSSILALPVLISSGAQPGKRYEVTLLARSATNTLSETLHVVIEVETDPVFDEGTILGKVFDDRNEDGVQNGSEIGVPRVRLYTEYGVSLVTDKDGRFHLPAVRPGRHVLKIDSHTLPAGTRFITEESLVVKTTPGLLSKVRFAVRVPESALPDEFKKELQIWVTQGIDLTQPDLRVSLEPSLLKVGLGRFEREPRFRIDTNYGEYLASWRLEIRNEMGERVWSGVGISEPPPQVFWNGMTDLGEMIHPGVYSYRLIVRDAQEHEDWTPLGFFRVVHKARDFSDSPEALEIPSLGNFNVSRDGKRSIPLVAKPSVRVYGKTEPGRRVQIGQQPVEVGPTGEFEKEFFVTPGEKNMVVSAADARGEAVTVEEKITVKDSLFFLVALGEEELGLNHMTGNLETVGREEAFHEDFYQDGRLSYYLKAKLKGKFLVKSRYDTGDKRSQLFTRLDPDDYYPIYGDYSQIEYEGQETQERLFLLVEMDRSFLKWGSYETGFTQTELARYNRTLSGLKIHHETLSTTRYGDAKRGFTLFLSKARTAADHNEFRATGGSLYYLRNRNAISGSEKIRIEIRDKIQDLPVESRDLTYGQDYEIDYKQGRILLKNPLSSISASETIITNDILDGNPVFLIVDYEYENFRALNDDQPRGFRGFTHLGDHLRVGGTAVEEKRLNTDYDLRAVDATLRSGRNTKITAEFGQAKFQQVSQSTSFDGGLSFRNQGPLPSRRPREKAYLIKGETKPLESVEFSGYLQNVEPGFSVDRIKSQEGFRKYGFQGRLKVSDSFYLLGRHDSSEVSAQIRPLSLRGVSTSFEKIRSTTGQAVFNQGSWNVIGEYLHQDLDIPLQNRINSFFSEMPFGNAVGLKVKRRVSEWLSPYVKTQYAFSGKNNFQAGGGVELQVKDQTQVFFEEMLGRAGDATVLGVNHRQNEKTTSYATVKSRDLSLGAREVSTSFGSSHQLSEKSRVYSERQYSTYSGNLPPSLIPTAFGSEGSSGLWASDIYGYENNFSKHWDMGLRFERRHLNASDFRLLGDEAINNQTRTNTFNTLALRVGYTEPEKWKWDDSVELRLEPDAPEIRQWVTQNSAEWRINQDLSFLGRANFGNSRFLDPSDLTARFLEFSTGLAYRPVDSDRLNWLMRYTLFHERANDAQFEGADSGLVAVDELSHIVSLEGAYELTKYFQVVEKWAYRLSTLNTSTVSRLNLGTFLWVQRFNYHVTRKWDVGAEYRMLFQLNTADSLRHGPLVEVDRELYHYIRLGIGYNFTDFDDDLRNTNDFSRSGFFVRLTGKV